MHKIHKNYFRLKQCTMILHQAKAGKHECNNKAAKIACSPLSSLVLYSDTKLAVQSFIKQKWQREQNAQTENKLNEIKPNIAIWPTFMPRKPSEKQMAKRMGQSLQQQVKGN